MKKKDSPSPLNTPKRSAKRHLGLCETTRRLSFRPYYWYA